MIRVAWIDDFTSFPYIWEIIVGEGNSLHPILWKNFKLEWPGHWESWRYSNDFEKVQIIPLREWKLMPLPTPPPPKVKLQENGTFTYKHWPKFFFGPCFPLHLVISLLGLCSSMFQENSGAQAWNQVPYFLVQGSIHNKTI